MPGAPRRRNAGPHQAACRNTSVQNRLIWAAPLGRRKRKPVRAD